MDVPNPPFRTVTEELLYNIYLKLQGGNLNGLTANDINTLAKLNAILTDAVLMKADDITNALNRLKGDVPEVANSLEKLYNIIQGLTYLKHEDIDTLSELNAILLDADLVRTEDLTNALDGLELNTRRMIHFYFTGDNWDDDHKHNNDRDTFILRGKVSSLAEDFTNELSGVTYKTRLDASSTWVAHSNLASVQSWINTFITGNEFEGTKYWIKCLGIYKQNKSGQAWNVLTYIVV
jgi:uncharacterized protein HemX